ncbi:MAG: ankyrin repeat domain-containing protein, partial [bacterium]
MKKLTLSLVIFIFLNIRIVALMPNGDLSGITKIGETMTYTQYLKRHPEEMKIVDKNGQSIFFYIIDNCYNTIPIAVAMGAPINEPDYKGRTPLLYAMQLNGPKYNSNAKFTVAEELLANGANPNIPDYDGNYPLFIALSKSTTHLPMLCKYNANVNIIDKDGDSFLMRLIKNGEFTDIPSYIVAKKPDVNYQNSKGNTILHEAIIKKLPLMIKTVMSLKPDLSIKNNDGDTPLNLVLKNNIPGVAMDMINAMGKDFVNMENLNSETPFSLAVTCKLDTIVSRDKNNPFDEGITERKVIVEKLFSLGADVECRDINGLTPVQLAENPDVTDFLLNVCKADYHVLNAKGDNLWFLHAVKLNNESVVKVEPFYVNDMRINK